MHDRYQAAYAADPAPHTRLYADAGDALPALHAAGVALGICTNKTTDVSRLVLRAVGLDGVIDALRGYDATRHPKPDPRHLLETDRRARARRGDVVYVGDNPVDLAVADAAGVAYRHVAGASRCAATWSRLERFADLSPEPARSMTALTPQDRAKRAVGIAAVERYVKPGMLLGLGSGTTSHWFVRALGAAVADGLEVRGVPTSTSTRELAESLRIPLVGLRRDRPARADRRRPRRGRPRRPHDQGRRRVPAVGADRRRRGRPLRRRGRHLEALDRLGAFPLPIEVVQHGWQSTARSIGRLLALHGYPADVPLVRRVDAAGAPVITDSGNFLVDAHLGSIADPLVIDRELNWIPGVVENGLFTGLADEVLFADPQGTITVMRCGSAPAGRPTTTPRGRGA